MTTSGNRLTSVQIRQLEIISVNGSFYRKHAIALLAINNGVTQAAAATSSGLTLNQVRYWLKKFRSQGLQAFPETVVDKQTIPMAKIKQDKHKKAEKKKEKKNKKSKKKTKNKK